MPTSPATPEPSRRIGDLAAWRPSARSLLWIVGAFVLGLLLFLLVWANGNDSDFYRTGPAAPTAAAPSYTPLPAPMSSDGDTVAEAARTPREVTETQPVDSEDRPRLVETTPPPPPALASAETESRSEPVGASQPLALSTPAPRYPAAALRRGERGTVMVSAQIGPDGVPSAVEVARSSGSRLLDRAAVDAVRRWRFRPAQVEGRPTTGQVQVPISFEN